MNGIQEVSGSIPLISTKILKSSDFRIFCFSTLRIALLRRAAALRLPRLMMRTISADHDGVNYFLLGLEPLFFVMFLYAPRDIVTPYNGICIGTPACQMLH